MQGAGRGGQRLQAASVSVRREPGRVGGAHAARGCAGERAGNVALCFFDNKHCNDVWVPKVREVHALVERVRQTDGALGRVCKEVVTSMHVPQVFVLRVFGARAFH